MEKHPTVALSTCEAEYTAMTPAIQEAQYLMQLINEMDKTKRWKQATLYSDNQSAICIAKNSITSQRVKKNRHKVPLYKGQNKQWYNPIELCAYRQKYSRLLHKTPGKDPPSLRKD